MSTGTVEFLAHVPLFDLHVQSQGLSCPAMGPQPENGEYKMVTEVNTIETAHMGTFASHIGNRLLRVLYGGRVPPCHVHLKTVTSIEGLCGQCNGFFMHNRVDLEDYLNNADGR